MWSWGRCPPRGDSGTLTTVLLSQPYAEPLYVYVVLNHLLALKGQWWPGEGFILNPSVAISVGSHLSNGSSKASLFSVLEEKRTCESCGEFMLSLGICHLLSLLVPVPPR